MSDDKPSKRGKSTGSRATQFKKNHLPMGGRPEGATNKKTLAQRLLALADEKRGLTEGGKKKRLSRIEIAWIRLLNLAASKDDKLAINLVINQYEKFQKIASATKSEPYPFSSLDRQVINEMYERMKLCEADQPHDSDKPDQSDELDERNDRNDPGDSEPSQ